MALVQALKQQAGAYSCSPLVPEPSHGLFWAAWAESVLLSSLNMSLVHPSTGRSVPWGKVTCWQLWVAGPATAVVPSRLLRGLRSLMTLSFLEVPCLSQMSDVWTKVASCLCPMSVRPELSSAHGSCPCLTEQALGFGWAPSVQKNAPTSDPWCVAAPCSMLAWQVIYRFVTILPNLCNLCL